MRNFLHIIGGYEGLGRRVPHSGSILVLNIQAIAGAGCRLQQ